jgi:hypothetical protein
MKWFMYVKLGAEIYKLLLAKFPQLSKVPAADVIALVLELLTTEATVNDVKIQEEPKPSTLMGTELRPTASHYRLVITKPPKAGKRNG